MLIEIVGRVAAETGLHLLKGAALAVGVVGGTVVTLYLADKAGLTTRAADVGRELADISGSAVGRVVAAKLEPKMAELASASAKAAGEAAADKITPHLPSLAKAAVVAYLEKKAEEAAA